MGFTLSTVALLLALALGGCTSDPSPSPLPDEGAEPPIEQRVHTDGCRFGLLLARNVSASDENHSMFDIERTDGRAYLRDELTYRIDIEHDDGTRHRHDGPLDDGRVELADRGGREGALDPDDMLVVHARTFGLDLLRDGDLVGSTSRCY